MNKRMWRIIFVLFIVALAVPVIYRIYRIFLADRIVRSEQTVESYSRALSYDPSNAELWWKRGRLRHYSVKDVDIIQAMKDYQRALELNPRLSQAWVDLADAYERTGKIKEAEAALEKAFETHTYSPLIRWQAGNFFLRQGNLPKMYECFKMASQYDVEKLSIAIEVAWKIDPDHAEILQKLVPDNLLCNMRYLGFLVDKNELDLASFVWQRCLKNEITPDFEFKASSLFNYIDHLLQKDRVSEALIIWDNALRKARTGLADVRLKEATSGKPQIEAPNLVWNGSFENEILRGGFDWRYPDIPDVKLHVDISNRMDNLKSLCATFNDVNVSSGYLSQIVPIFVSGSYTLDCYLKTEGLTTDQTPYLSIHGYPDASAVSAHSNYFPGTTDWIKVSVPFVVRDNCKAVQLSLQRDRSSKFDNQIKGSLWLDGVSIRNQQSADVSSHAPGKVSNNP